MKAAILGAGAIAREHLASLRKLPGVELAAVCDLSPAMAEVTAEQFGVRAFFTDHRRMLAETRPDVVHVLTPPHTHFTLARDALDAGAHVIVEKPITLSLSELEELCAHADRRGRLLIEDHNYTFNAPVQRLLALLESGELGQVVHVEVSIALQILGPESRATDPNLPHPCLELPGGVITDFLSHLAYLAWLFVGPHRSVQASWRKRMTASPLPSDELRALVEAERGSALLSFSAHAQPDAFHLRVHGTKLRAHGSLFEGLLAIERLREGARPLMPVKNGLALGRAHARAAFGGLWRKLSGRPLGYEGLHELVSRSYAAASMGGEPPITRRQIVEANQLVAAILATEVRA